MHSLKFALPLFLFLVLNDLSYANIINIPEDYQSIQSGLDNRESGDTIIIQPGIYYENLIVTGSCFTLASNYFLTGDSSYISSTIIDGNCDGRVITMSNIEESQSLISGLTVQNGYFPEGAGIFIDYVDITLRNNIIANNHAISDSGHNAYGGGILCHGCDPIIIDNVITRNSAEYYLYKDGYGGGICCIEANAVIESNIITENSASGVTSGGAGIYGDRSELIIKNNIFLLNTSNWGSAISLSNHGNTIITGNIISHNYGGAILFKTSPDGVAINNTIMGNYWAGGITCLSGCHPKIVNNIIRDNEQYNIYTSGGRQPEINFNNINGGWDGVGNIDFDPLFRDTANNDYHLMATACGDSIDSPCIDTGDPHIIDSDLCCLLGLGDIRGDIGAYGGGDSVQLDIGDYTGTAPTKIKLGRNYPNPFNTSTLIQYEVENDTQVKIDIYDILGRKLETLCDGKQPAGKHNIVWNPGEISSGIYFYEIQAGEISERKKMVLLK